MGIPARPGQGRVFQHRCPNGGDGKPRACVSGAGVHPPGAGGAYLQRTRLPGGRGLLFCRGRRRRPRLPLSGRAGGGMELHLPAGLSGRRPGPLPGPGQRAAGVSAAVQPALPFPASQRRPFHRRRRPGSAGDGGDSGGIRGGAARTGAAYPCLLNGNPHCDHAAAL